MTESRQERQMDYRRRLLHDMDVVLRSYGVSAVSMFGEEQYDMLLQELVDCAMFHVEHLLVEATT